MNTINYDTTAMLISKMHQAKHDFINKMLLKKGYKDLLAFNHDQQVQRFPKVQKVFFNNWEYYFVDNNTKNGDFIVAIGPWESNLELDSNCKINYTFKWQDTNFDCVKL